MTIVACRWDPVVLAGLLDAGACVSLVIDAWEAAHRRLDPGVVDRLVRLDVVESFDSLEALGAVATLLQGALPEVDVVLSLAEYGQLAAAYLAGLLGLDRPDPVQSVLVRDKRAMKERARRGGLSCARQVELDRHTPGDAVAAAVAELGTPVVIKPASGMGTVDTWVCNSAEEALLRLDGVASPTQMIAEEYVTGDEFHVDAVWLDGVPVVLGLSRYLVPRIEIETPGHLNGSALLRRTDHAEAYEEVEELSQQVSEIFGVRDGITHLELFRTPDGRWVFSELATRPAGGAICEVYGLLGADLRTIWARSVVERVSDVELALPPDRLLGWVNLAPSTVGVVEVAPTREQLLAVPFVLDVVEGHRPGDRVTELHPSVWSWRVFFSADSWEEFRSRTLQVEKVARFEVRAAEPSQPR